MNKRQLALCLILILLLAYTLTWTAAQAFNPANGVS
jgi:hypothetical protein